MFEWKSILVYVVVLFINFGSWYNVWGYCKLSSEGILKRLTKMLVFIALNTALLFSCGVMTIFCLFIFGSWKIFLLGLLIYSMFSYGIGAVCYFLSESIRIHHTKMDIKVEVYNQLKGLIDLIPSGKGIGEKEKKFNGSLKITQLLNHRIIKEMEMIGYSDVKFDKDNAWYQGKGDIRNFVVRHKNDDPEQETKFLEDAKGSGFEPWIIEIDLEEPLGKSAEWYRVYDKDTK